MDHHWYTQQAAITLNRIKPRLAVLIQDDNVANEFYRRLSAHFPALFGVLHQLYGSQYDFFFHLEQILASAARLYLERPHMLKALDRERETHPQWYQSQEMIGAVCYVDRFAKDLSGLSERLPYLKELGVTYLHLMPLFECPADRNDGGYAVSSFRRVNPALGSMEQLAALAAEFRQHGISLVLDFVFNHTSEEHEWAKAALAGDPTYQAYYRMFPDRSLPDAYERSLREIFPEQAPGSFTWRPEIQKWVWTTFFDFQWDLNYENPEVFRAMMEEMLFLANQGVEILRLDAVPFVWKQLGTNSENLPQAHLIIQAYNALARIVAPALIFKSEAIVHPRDVQSYVRVDECQLSYNPILMVCLWDALATRDTRLLTHTMQKRFTLDPQCAWVNYVRSHDDIGWGFADEDAAEVGINGIDHRFFLNLFYTGRFPGSHAAGVPFNYNPRTQDMRISGTTASLAGLEKAIEAQDDTLITHSLRRLLLIQGIVLAAGGIPLLYLGDEIATLNDYSYTNDTRLADDSRWLHRPKHNWERTEHRQDLETIEGRLYQHLLRLIRLRKALPALANGSADFHQTGSRHLFAFSRHQQVLVIGNFSDMAQSVQPRRIAAWLHGADTVYDLITGLAYTEPNLLLHPYEIVWLSAQPLSE